MGEKRARAYDAKMHEQYSKRTKATHKKSMTKMLRFAGESHLEMLRFAEDSQRNLLEMATIMQPGGTEEKRREAKRREEKRREDKRREEKRREEKK